MIINKLDHWVCTDYEKNNNNFTRFVELNGISKDFFVKFAYSKLELWHHHCIP